MTIHHGHIEQAPESYQREVYATCDLQDRYIEPEVTGDWDAVTCKICPRYRAAHERQEKEIVKQMGEMAEFLTRPPPRLTRRRTRNEGS